MSVGKRILMYLEVLSAIVITLIFALRFIYKYLKPSTLKTIQGSVVVVTDSGKGLGRELALQLAKNHGCTVVCVDKDDAACLETADEINTLCGCGTGIDKVANHFPCDISDNKQVRKLTEDIKKEFGTVDILIDNTGLDNQQLQHSTCSVEHVVDLVNTNLMAHFYILLAFLPGMLEKGSGHVVTVSSRPERLENYNGTRSALLELMTAMTNELQHHSRNITITCVHTTASKWSKFTIENTAADIILGLRQNKQAISVPRPMSLARNILK